ncbi:hypothetical protein Cpir12675_004190 [Ceratocystis pirilliformis]|uniref:NB-ARC domain-containing protein n=1 Tax=Ceratocystis pirilliformis TaxID=259994 RepID=A0ABR3YZA4_9PEZI
MSRRSFVTNLENAIKKMVCENKNEPESTMYETENESTATRCRQHEDLPFRNKSCAKTIVLAMTRVNIEARPTLFTTYDVSESFSDCKIWEVARATSATAPIFPPIKVGRDGIEFIDALFGYNNPCEVLIHEAEKQSPGHEMIITSIGTGCGKIIEIGNTKKSMLNAVKGMAQSSKTIASRLEERYADTGYYYRLNVENGLEDIKYLESDILSRISSHTHNYIKEKQGLITKVAKRLLSGSPQGLASHIPQKLANNGLQSTQPVEHANPSVFCSIPFNEDKSFVGRVDILSRLKDKLFTQTSFRQAALVGLGGIGKTQIALKFAYTVKTDKPNYSIFWMCASSVAGLSDACKSLAEKLGVEETKNPMAFVKRYLESEEAGDWLLIFDNADDIGVFCTSTRSGNHYFLPQSERGRILFTTRSRHVAQSLINNDDCIMLVEELPANELATILKSNMGNLNSTPHQHDKALENSLIEELCHLPLAIAQAGIYIRMNKISISEYLDLLKLGGKDKIQLLDKHFPRVTGGHVSESAVGNTWLTTLNKIQESSTPATTLLEFIANIEPKSIPKSIFPELGSQQQMVEAIGILESYSFLRKQKNPELFDMHSLVHLVTRLWFERLSNSDERRQAIVEHMSSVSTNDWDLRKLHLPHELCVFKREKAMTRDLCNLALKIGQCLLKGWDIADAIEMFQYVIITKGEAPATDDSLLHDAQYELARAFLRDDQVKESIEMYEQVAKAKERSLLANDTSLLSFQYELAQVYHSHGEFEKKISILEHIVRMREDALPVDDSLLLSAQYDLSDAYRCLSNKGSKEISTLEHAVEIWQRDPAKNYASLSICQLHLARAYRRNKQPKKTISILEDLVRTKTQSLSAHSPTFGQSAVNDTVFVEAQNELVQEYFDTGRQKLGISLLQVIFDMREQLLPNNDPLVLDSKQRLEEALRSFVVFTHQR